MSNIWPVFSGAFAEVRKAICLIMSDYPSVRPYGTTRLYEYFSKICRENSDTDPGSSAIMQ